MQEYRLATHCLIEVKAGLVVYFHVVLLLAMRLFKFQLLVNFCNWHELVVVLLLFQVQSLLLLLTVLDCFGYKWLYFHFLARLLELELLFQVDYIFRVNT